MFLTFVDAASPPRHGEEKCAPRGQCGEGLFSGGAEAANYGCGGCTVRWIVPVVMKVGMRSERAAPAMHSLTAVDVMSSTRRFTTRPSRSGSMWTCASMPAPQLCSRHALRVAGRRARRSVHVRAADDPSVHYRASDPVAAVRCRIAVGSTCAIASCGIARRRDAGVAARGRSTRTSLARGSCAPNAIVRARRHAGAVEGSRGSTASDHSSAPERATSTRGSRSRRAVSARRQGHAVDRECSTAHRGRKVERLAIVREQLFVERVDASLAPCATRRGSRDVAPSSISSPASTSRSGRTLARHVHLARDHRTRTESPSSARRIRRPSRARSIRPTASRHDRARAQGHRARASPFVSTMVMSSVDNVASSISVPALASTRTRRAARRPLARCDRR